MYTTRPTRGIQSINQPIAKGQRTTSTWFALMELPRERQTQGTALDCGCLEQRPWHGSRAVTLKSLEEFLTWRKKGLHLSVPSKKEGPACTHINEATETRKVGFISQYRLASFEEFRLPRLSSSPTVIPQTPHGTGIFASIHPFSTTPMYTAVLWHV